MPEPDLPRLILTEVSLSVLLHYRYCSAIARASFDHCKQEYIDKLRATLPEFPDDTRARLMRQYGLTLKGANTLLGEARAVEYFETLCATPSRNPQNVFNWYNFV